MKLLRSGADESEVPMKFINRKEEMRRLLQSADSGGAGFVVVWGRRRMGKSRLLTEWSQQRRGLYWVAED